MYTKNRHSFCVLFIFKINLAKHTGTKQEVQIIKIKRLFA